jgi:hypothetical protein
MSSLVELRVKLSNVGFGVLTEVFMKNYIFWNIPQAGAAFSRWFLLLLLFIPEDFPPKRPLTFSGLNDIMTQTMEFFKYSNFRQSLNVEQKFVVTRYKQTLYLTKCINTE